MKYNNNNDVINKFMFRTAVRVFLFLATFHARKTWFKLSRVEF